MELKQLATMGGIAIGTAVVENICNAMGKPELASYVRVGGTGFTALIGITIASRVLKTVSTLI